jgi:hypothetical protein
MWALLLGKWKMNIIFYFTVINLTDFSSVFINQTSLSFEFKRLKLGQLFAISLSRRFRSFSSLLQWNRKWYSSSTSPEEQRSHFISCRRVLSPHYYSNNYSKEHEIAWLSFLLWTRGGLHINKLNCQLILTNKICAALLLLSVMEAMFNRILFCCNWHLYTLICTDFAVICCFIYVKQSWLLNVSAPLGTWFGK